MSRLYQIFILLVFIVISCITVSCNSNEERVIAQETFSFLNDNWNFEQRLIIFEKEIDTDKPCKIVMDLCCTKEFTAEKLPVILSLYDVEGSESHRTNIFNFKIKKDMTEKVEGNLTTYTLTVYPKKYFSVKGKYKFRLLHTYYNYNLLGIRSVTVRVLEMKETEE
jgi:gliding motility-associated lipoprotein GldH